MSRPSLLYCHGLPGGAAELALADADLPVLDRRQITDLAQPSPCLPDGALHLIGFSLGASFALRLAAHHPGRVAKLTLISAAAPLELGNFLPDMAGQAVFRLARRPALFRAVTGVQGAIAHAAPGVLASQLIATCDPSDRKLLQGSGKPAFIAALQQGYGTNRLAYLREVCAYVRPWANLLDQVHCPVELHHGSADLWAPAAMSDALHTALPQSSLTRHDGLGHYSTLVEVMRNFPA